MPAGRQAGAMTQARVLFTPWEQVLPGTRRPLLPDSPLPTCPGPTRRQLPPCPERPPPQPLAAGAWGVPAVGRLPWRHALSLESAHFT